MPPPSAKLSDIQEGRTPSLILSSLRAIYGTDELRNALHGSNDFAASEREIRFMFPEGESAVPALSTAPPVVGLLKGLLYLENTAGKEDSIFLQTCFRV